MRGQYEITDPRMRGDNTTYLLDPRIRGDNFDRQLALLAGSQLLHINVFSSQNHPNTL